MKSACKLLFSFVVLKKDLMPLDYLSSPRECVTGVKKGDKNTFMAIFGLHALPGKPINTYASISPVGKEPPIDLAKLGDAASYTLRATPLPDGMGVFLMAVEVKDVVFEDDGMHEINVRIFPSDETPSTENEIDSIRNYFFVLTAKGEKNGIR